jgi:hypothetical protein
LKHIFHGEVPPASGLRPAGRFASQAEAEQQQQHSAAGKADNNWKFFEPSEAAAL